MNEPVAELVLEQMAVGDASSLRVKWLIEDYPPVGTKLYTHPVKELHLSLQKDKETGELLAVTYTDDEHRIVEVLWQRPPVKELNDGGEPVKNATYWKRQYNLMATQNDNLKSGLYHANEQIKYLESHPAELTDEEKWEVFTNLARSPDLRADMIRFADSILRKAQE